MSDEKVKRVAEGEYHSNGRLCTTDKYGRDCAHYESNELMHLGLYHTCGSCKYWGVIGNLEKVGGGNACFNDKNNRPE